MARSAGIRFPYVGNVPGHKFENTNCPSCGKVLIERQNYKILALRLLDGRCPACGETIPIVMKLSG
jgi:pyruvate formate lyase activating enzyme